MTNASTVDIRIRAIADLEAIDTAVKTFGDLQTATGKVSDAFKSIGTAAFDGDLGKAIQSVSRIQTEMTNAAAAAQNLLSKFGISSQEIAGKLNIPNIGKLTGEIVKLSDVFKDSSFQGDAANLFDTLAKGLDGLEGGEVDGLTNQLKTLTSIVPSLADVSNTMTAINGTFSILSRFNTPFFGPNAIKSMADLKAFLQLSPSLFAGLAGSVTAIAGPLAVAVAGVLALAAAVKAVQEGLKMFKASQEQDKAELGARQSHAAVQDTLLKEIERQEAEGLLTAAQANLNRKRVNDASLSDSDDPEIEEKKRIMLKKVSEQLRSKYGADSSPTTEAIPHLESSLAQDTEIPKKQIQAATIASAQEQNLIENQLQAEQNVAQERERNAQARIDLHQATGQQILVQEQRHQIELEQISEGEASSDESNGVQDLQHAYAQVNTELEKRSEVQDAYQLKVAETNRLIDEGAISQNEGAQRNNEAAKEYEGIVTRIRDRISEIVEANPGLANLIPGLRQVQSDLEPDAMSQGFSSEANMPHRFNEGMSHLQKEAGAVGQIMQGTIGAAMSNINDGITNLINGTATWGQTFAQVGTQIVRSLIKIGVEMIAQATLGKVLSLAAKATAAATGASITGSMAPAAAATSAATFGGNTASIGATVAAIVAAVGSITSLKFAEGGLVPGAPSSRDNRIAAVATGEFINRAAAVQYYGPGVFQALNEMRIPRASLDHMRVPVRPSLSAGFATGGLVGPMPSIGSGATNVNVAPAPVQVAVLKDQADYRQFLESHAGRRIIITTVKGAKEEIGILS